MAPINMNISTSDLSDFSTRSPPTSTTSLSSNTSNSSNSPEVSRKISDLKALSKSLRKKKQNIGVIGGSGPEAGVNVVSTIISIYKERAGKAYKNDKDAPNVTLMQHSGVGGPHGYWDLADMSSPDYQDLWSEMTDTILKLEMIGAACFCITCNTLHALEPELRKWLKARNSKIQFVSIIESTQQAILKDVEKKKREEENSKSLNKPEYSFGRNNTFTPSFNLESNKESNPARIGMLGSYFTTGVHEDSPYKNLVPKGSEELEFAEINKDERNRLQELINETKRCGPLPELQDAFFNFVVDNFLEDCLVTIPENEEVNIDCEELEVARPDCDELEGDFNDFPSSRLSMQEENANLVNPILTNNKKAICDYLVLGCTELPLLLTEEKRVLLSETFGVAIIDPNATLAETLLRECDYLKEEEECCKKAESNANMNANVRSPTAVNAPKKPTKLMQADDVREAAADKNMASWSPFVSGNTFMEKLGSNASISTGVSSGPSYFGNISNPFDNNNSNKSTTSIASTFGSSDMIFGNKSSENTAVSMNDVLNGVTSSSTDGDFYLRSSRSNSGNALPPKNSPMNIGTASPFENNAVSNMTIGNSVSSNSAAKFFAPECGYLSDIACERKESNLNNNSSNAIIANNNSPTENNGSLNNLFPGTTQQQNCTPSASNSETETTASQPTLSKKFIQNFYGLNKNGCGSGNFGSSTDLGSTTCGGKSTAVSLKSNQSCGSFTESHDNTQHFKDYQDINYDEFENYDHDDDEDEHDEDEELQELNDKIIHGKYGNLIQNLTADGKEGHAIDPLQPRITSKDRVRLPKDSLEARMRNKLF